MEENSKHVNIDSNTAYCISLKHCFQSIISLSSSPQRTVNRTWIVTWFHQNEESEARSIASLAKHHKIYKQ